MFGPTLTPADFSNTFTPAQIANLLQWFDPAYSPTTLNSLPVFVPKETGTLAVPRAGRCVVLDGLDDYISMTSMALGTAHTLCVEAKPVSGAMFGSSTTIHGLRWVSNTLSYATGGASASVAYAVDGGWHRFCVVRNGTSVSFYVDGVQVGTTQTLGSNPSLVCDQVAISSGVKLSGSFCNVRIYNVAKTSTEVLAIANQHLTPGVVDTVGALGIWPLQEEGVLNNGLHFNVVDPTKPLTTNNITASTYNATDTGVKYSFPNAKGYTPIKTISLSNATGGAGYDSDRTWVSIDARSGDFTVDFQVSAINSNAVFGVQLESAASALDNFGIADIGLQFTSSTNLNVFVNFNSTGSATGHTIASTTAPANVRVSRSGTTASIFVNGVLVTTRTVSASPMYPVCSFTGGVNAIAVTVLNESNAGTQGAKVTGSNVIIPASLTTPALDASGGALGVAGPVALPAGTEVNCFTGDGAAAHINFGAPYIPNTDVTISFLFWPSVGAFYDRVLSQTSGGAGGFELVQNDTGTQLMFFIDGDAGTLSTLATTIPGAWNFITVTRLGNLWTITATSPTGAVSTASVTKAVTVTQAVNLFALKYAPSASNYSPGRLCGLAITSGGITKWPLFDQCGPGTLNTNRDFYVMGSDGSATLVTNGKVGGTVANTHANRCQYVRDWCVQYGGSHNPNMLGGSNGLTTGWTPLATAIVVNAIANPLDGSVNASLLRETATTANHYYYHATGVMSGATYTFSVYAKAATRSILGLVFQGSLGDIGAYFDLSSGTMIQRLVPATPIGHTIVDVGGGWYRVSITVTQTATTVYPYLILSDGSPGASLDTYAGDGTSGVYVFGAQCELGSVTTPYQANTTTPNGAFIPGRIGSSLDAAGNTKTLVAGKHGNPYSRVVPNWANAPALVNIGVTSSTKLAPTDTYESATTATDDAYSRNKADGTDRYFATLAPLTGSNLTNADNYIG